MANDKFKVRTNGYNQYEVSKFNHGMQIINRLARDYDKLELVQCNQPQSYGSELTIVWHNEDPKSYKSYQLWYEVLMNRRFWWRQCLDNT